MRSTMSMERHITGTIRFKGEISKYDLAELNLNHFDKALLADCFEDGRTAADWLLGFELVFRRIQEQQPNVKVSDGATDAMKAAERDPRPLLRGLL